MGNSSAKYVDLYGLSKFDKWWGYTNTQFQRWFHRTQKNDGDPDIPDKKTADELWKQWNNEGQPGPDKKRNQRNNEGFLDPAMMLLLIPWWAAPSTLSDCDEDGNCQDMLPNPPANTCNADR